MGRTKNKTVYRRRKKQNQIAMENLDEIRYQEAVKRVKKVKSFYIHLLVFVVINIVIVYLNSRELEPNETMLQFRVFSTFIFWGIGLVAHGLTVFLPGFLLGKEWEEKKIRQLMEETKNNKWE